ncbi:unnamed protein product [Polarella glacialis]|uniref:Uncharacterized protein n=1 Tax=Polarella glacialis TaxID=89957 RepID=A0A813DRB2_POLGL|nr:unnamed protein product [Polarella glacialis]
MASAPGASMTLFAFAGEGVHSQSSDLSMVRRSPSFASCAAALANLGMGMEDVLREGLGVHAAPFSVIATTVINICLCDTWKSWGYKPDAACGHSVGELGAAYASGIYTLEQTLQAAVVLGGIAAKQAGAMLHTTASLSQLAAQLAESDLALAAINSRLVCNEGPDDQAQVTLCGTEASIKAWLVKDENASMMRPKHPWHHPSYAPLLTDVDRAALQGLAATMPAGRGECRFVSATKAKELHAVDGEHWLAWLSQPVLFADTVDYLARESGPLGSAACTVIEIGAHPVLSAMLHSLKPSMQVSSMCRDQSSVNWMLEQRSALPTQALKAVLSKLEVAGRLISDLPFGVQGFTSVQYPLIAQALDTCFPNLKAFDLYRFQTLDALIANYGRSAMPSILSAPTLPVSLSAAVLGIGLVLPPTVTSCSELWAALLKCDNAVRKVPGRKHAGGYLDERAFSPKRDGSVLGIEAAEAAVIDPQHVLALALAARCFEDAGQEAAAEAFAKPDRCGVYLGAWQEPPQVAARTPSAYRVLGTSLSAMASRVANTYDIQGPAMTINTACSSGLVAVNAALKDMRLGVIDYALVGCVNLLTDEALSDDLARAHFLSPTGACHTFSAAADGYARSEGGVMLLLARDDGIRPCRALVCGSATNQNSRRRPMTAVDPTAQERVIRAACADGGIKPSEVAVVECHGTGTKLGDPVEVSALAATVGAGRGSECLLTAAKMVFGHLESAAGGLGLVKAVLMAQRRQVPGATVAAVNPAVAEAMSGASLQLPSAEGAELAEGAYIGVSSFGFAGNNAHVIVQVAPNGRRMPFIEAAEPALAPVAALAVATQPVRKPEPVQHKPKGPTDLAISNLSMGDVQKLVWASCEEICEGISEGNKTEIPIFELGIDSLGLAELLITLESRFGDGCVSVDEVMEDPSVSAIVSLLLSKQSKSIVESPSQQSKDLEPASPLIAEGKLSMLGGVDVAEMQRSSASAEPQGVNSWVRTTHVGSLPRPSGTSLEDIISKQIDAGIDWMNDGEWTRENYISDALSRISGIGGNVQTTGECMCCMPSPSDMHDVPMFARRFTGGNGLITLNPARVAKADVACTAPMTYINPETLFDSLQPFLDVIGSRDRSTCFWSVPSPGTLAVFCEDRHYGDYSKFAGALAEVLRLEYEAVAATGLVLQVDAPCLAMGRHTRHSALTDEQFQEVLRTNVDLINATLVNIDPAMVRVHVCWGNYSGPHHHDIEARHVWPHLLRLKARYISIEGANPRHAHDWEYFAKHVAAKFIELDKVILVGVLDTRSAHIEHPELIAQRLLRYVKVLGPGRVVASTDCGFATTGKSAAITEDIVWLKLAALGEGARIVRQRLVDVGAPEPTSLVYSPTGFRVVVFRDAEAEACPGAKGLISELARRSWSLDVLPSGAGAQSGFEQLKYSLDTPMALVALGAQAATMACGVAKLLEGDCSVSRRPHTIFTFGQQQPGAECLGAAPLEPEAAKAAAAEIQARMQRRMRFDKRKLTPSGSLLSPATPPSEVDVVVVGAGMLGLYMAVTLTRRGFKVVVLEQRMIIGGIWSMYANSHSQVNSSEGGYSLKDILGESGANRDHATAREMITDIAKLAKEVDASTCCGVKVERIAKHGDGWMTISQTEHGGTHITSSRGVVLAINDRVGIPRQMTWAGQEGFRGIVTTGTNDNLANVDWRGKRVVVVGMGAFAIENTRTALEHGADHVTVVVRRHGTVCPKIIDYLNFVKPFDAEFQHDSTTNIKQMHQWSSLYRKSGATIPECWPEEIKHEGHTISVSDLWFVGHHMGKLCTKVATVDHFDAGGIHLSDGSRLDADIVVVCVGFIRNTHLCEKLTGTDTMKTTNYVGKHLMYLADAEIDHGAFNWFFGSSVLEYAKFFTEVYVAGLEHEEQVGEMLWGDDLPTTKIQERKWSGFIAASSKLLKAKADGIPYFADAAHNQVEKRTRHFYNTLPPVAYVKSNEAEWVELHTRLNGGVPVAPELQLPYFFKDAASWCEPKAPLA